MVENLWGQFQQALKNYQETTEERKNAFEELKAKDKKNADEIEMQMRKLQRISVSPALVIFRNLSNTIKCSSPPGGSSLSDTECYQTGLP